MLLTKIQNRQAVVSVIGLGYVGLPLAIAFAEAGFPVSGIDVDEKRVAYINRGESYVEDVPSETLARVVSQSAPMFNGERRPGFYATTDWDPFVPHFAVDGLAMTAVCLDQATVQSADCVVIITAHSAYDWPWVVEHSRLLVDTRNVTRGLQIAAQKAVKL